MKRRDLIKRIEQLGYHEDRTGDHTTYECKGKRPVQVPNHREIDEWLAKEIIKQAEGKRG